MTPDFRRKNQRGLTPFSARELFLDYLEERLDTGARAEFEKLLENDVSLRLDFEKFQDAVQYCRKISTFTPSPEAREEIASAPTPIENIAKKLNVHRWPTGLRWGMEALLIIGVLLVAVLVIPWGKIIRVPDREEITLAEIERAHTPSQGGDVAGTGAPAPAEAQFADEGAEDKKTAPATEKSAPKNSVSIAIPNVTLPAAPTPTPVPKPTPVAKATPPPKPTPAAPATPSPAAATTTSAGKATATTNAAAKPTATPGKSERPVAGSLYRGQIEVTNLEATTAKFVEQITAAGGRKAGEVELGWEKGQTRYFHFTIPEARYEEFLTFASQYGSPKINREPHPRIMPEGIVRVILVLREHGDSP